ncbi:MAG: membrane protein insertion efficiency factor YidD [Halieaceae bacterium]|nr:membrane protein insertion efficiency factor YidD [Halieaceae bacterium]
MTRLFIRVLITLIDGYRLLISPWLGRSCRFEPTCSSYARTAILRYGPVRGTWMAIRRIGRCHPWHPGGYDPVPEEKPHPTKP